MMLNSFTEAGQKTVWVVFGPLSIQAQLWNPIIDFC
jgi:hypothetical protein